MELNLKNYLKKFEQLLPYETRVRNATIKTIEEIFKTTIDRKKITVSGSQIFINAPSAVKSEIQLKQKSIIEKINEHDPAITITKIM